MAINIQCAKLNAQNDQEHNLKKETNDFLIVIKYIIKKTTKRHMISNSLSRHVPVTFHMALLSVSKIFVVFVHVYQTKWVE